MIIIIDTNIIISALIKDSVTRRIIITSGLQFYYPELSFQEMQKHKNTILQKSGISENSYNMLLNRLLEYIKLLPTENIMQKLEEAKKIMYHIDPNDVIFISSALNFEGSVIWSNDKDFDRQKRIPHITTKDLTRLLIKNKPYKDHTH